MTTGKAWTKYWSGQYCIAKKPGYYDSEIIKQSPAAWGIPQNIQFFMRPKPVGTAAEFAPYAARGALEAGDEFLKAYPETPIRAAVYAHMISRLPKDNRRAMRRSSGCWALIPASPTV